MVFPLALLFLILCDLWTVRCVPESYLHVHHGVECVGLIQVYERLARGPSGNTIAGQLSNLIGV